MSNCDKNKLLYNNNDDGNKIIINTNITTSSSSYSCSISPIIITKKEETEQKEIIVNKKPPTPPPLPIFNRITNKSFKMNNNGNTTTNDIQQQLLLVKSRQKLSTVDDEYLAIYNQKPKIIKYTPVQGNTNNNNNNNNNTIVTTTTTAASLTNGQIKRINLTKSPKDEVIHNNAKNSHIINDSIFYNIDNITPAEKVVEKIILSKQGTVRGNLNHVKISLKQFFKENHNSSIAASSINSLNSDKYSTYLTRDFETEELHKIIIYTTSLQIVRSSYAKCKRVKKILQNHCVRYEERDLYKNKEYQRELKYRLNLNSIDIPFIFFNSKLIGNCDQLESLSDQGYLNKLFKDLEKIKLRIYCSKCGGYRFVLCTLCNGSKKIYNNFTTLKCTTCNEDGLLRCDTCLDQQE